LIEAYIDSVKEHSAKFLDILLLERLCIRPVEGFSEELSFDWAFVDLKFETRKKLLELERDVVIEGVSLRFVSKKEVSDLGSHEKSL
jgi:hypothetical protein